MTFEFASWILYNIYALPLQSDGGELRMADLIFWVAIVGVWLLLAILVWRDK